MLDIMRVHGLMSTQELAGKILDQLNPSPVSSVEPEGKPNTYITTLIQRNNYCMVHMLDGAKF